MATYSIRNMRAIRPSDKMAEKHPDRFLTIYGEFFNESGNKLTITSKVISKSDAISSEFAIDIKKGILTLPDVERGRKKIESITQADIESELNSLRASVK